MARIVCKCAQCQSELKLNLTGTPAVVRVNCPKCSHVFNVKLPRSQSPGQSAHVAPLTLLTEEDLNPQPLAPYSPSAYQHRSNAQSTAQSPWNMPVAKQPRSSQYSGGSLKIVLGVLGILAAVGLVVVVGVGLYMKRSSLPDLAKITNKLNPFESPESIQRDIEQLRNRVESIAGQIPEGERETSGAERLKDFRPEFDKLLIRACRLPPVSRTLEEVVKDAEKRVEQQRLMRDQTSRDFSNGNSPKKFWTINLSARESSNWQKAINQLAETSYFASEATPNAHLAYPSPLTADSANFGWSDEDRRCLTVYWLQGKLAESLIREVAGVMNDEQVSDAQLQTMFEIMDGVAQEAVELAEVPSAQGKMLIDVPKGTSYEYQYKMATTVLKALKIKIQTDNRANKQPLLQTIGIGLRLIEDLEDIQFSRAGSVLKFAQSGSWEIFQKHRRELAEKEQADLLEKEKERFAALEQDRKKREADEQRKLEQDAKLRAEEEARARQMADAQSSSGNRPAEYLGGGFPGRMGPGSRFGNGGGESGFGGPGPSGPGFTPGGPPRPNAGGDMPKMTMQGVTIIANKINDQQFQQIATEVRQNFPNHTMNFSGGRMSIQIISFDRPLDDIQALLPSLKIESIDKVQRILQASAK